MKVFRKFIAVAVAFGFAISASAQQMPTIPVDQNVRLGHLDNGLTYYIRHNEEPKDQAFFYIAQKVGSILEDEDQRGLAHFLEHMCFNGTEHFAGNGVIKYLESIGVKFGADLNAYTSIDETVYNIDSVPVNVEGAIDSCLWILHDWADGLLLDGEEIDKERGVIHEEWRTRLNAQMRLYEQILPRIYPGNRYGQRLPIGLIEVIDNFPYQAIRDYYEKWYRPDQQGIVVVGDIDVDAIESKIKEIFGTIAKPVDPAERFYVQVEDNAEPIVAIAKDKELPYAMTYIFKKHEAVPFEAKNSLAYYVTQYVQNVADFMISQRLQELAMLPEPPFVQASIGDDDFFIAKTAKALTGMAVTTEAGVAKGATTLYREMLRIARNGFTASEYDRARAEIISQVESLYKEREKTQSINYCKEYVRHFIDNEPIPGIETEFALLNQLAPNIPVDAVNAYVKELVKDNNLVIVGMYPDKEGVTYPTEAEMAKLFADVEAEDIAPYEDKVSNEPLISELPAPGKVVKTKDAKFGYKMYTLSNGATVYVRSTDFKADEILMTAYSNGGTSLYPDSEALTLAQANSLAYVGGIGNFSTTDLNKALSGKQATVRSNISTYRESLSGSTTPKDFETMLQLTYLTMTAPRMDEDAYQSYANRLKASLENMALNPAAALQDSIATVVFNNHPRARQLKAADVASLDYGRAVEIAKERFANAADFVFIFTGNIDEETAIPLIEQYIGSLPAAGKKEKYKNVKLDYAKGGKECIFDKEMEIPKTTVLLLESGKAKYNLKNSLSLDIAEQILDIIFTEEIREKEGGTYGVGVASMFDRIPKPQELLQISFETDPDKYEHLTARVKEIIADFVANGPSQENLDKIKEYNRKDYAESQRKNSYFYGALSLYLNTGVDKCTDYLEVLDSITTEDVRKAVAGLVKQGNDITLIMNGTAKK